MDRLLENNTILKILSVVVAIFIWFQANTGVQAPINRSLGPLAVGYNPSLNSHLTVLSISPNAVTMSIKGPATTVESSSLPSDVSASVNLSSITKPGTYSLKVSGSVPPGVGVVSVTPQRVVVSVAKMGQQKVPVVVHIGGQPISGDQLISYKSDLKQADISGPTSALNQVRSVVGTLGIANRSGKFSSAVVLRPVNAQGVVVPKVQVNPPTARITATIEPKPPEKVLPIIGKVKGKPASGFQVSQITVYPSTVTVSGSKTILPGLDHIYTTVVNVSGATKTIAKSVPVVVPKGATLVSAGEVTITVTITASG